MQLEWENSNGIFRLFLIQEDVRNMTRITHSHEHAILGAILQHHAVHSALHLKHPSSDRQTRTDSHTHDSPSRDDGDSRTAQADTASQSGACSDGSGDSLDELAAGLNREAFIDRLLSRMSELEEEVVHEEYSTSSSSDESASDDQPREIKRKKV